MKTKYAKMSIVPILLSAPVQTIDAEGKDISSNEVKPNSHLTNGVVKHELTNKGEVSNLFCTPKGILRGGIVSGTIYNEGVMEDIEFSGKVIKGCELKGLKVYAMLLTLSVYNSEPRRQRM